LARPLDAVAANGDPLILGQENQADALTKLDGGLNVSQTIQVINNDPVEDVAIFAFSESGFGVAGESQGTRGLSSSGVRGVAGKRGGVAVSALNDADGLALHVAGKARFATRSGRATVLAGRSLVDIDLRAKGGLNGTPLCFANLMSDRPGVYVRTFRPNYPIAGKARIYLNRTVSSNAYVAWFVLN
jgi:hypothetical protein